MRHLCLDIFGWKQRLLHTGDPGRDIGGNTKGRMRGGRWGCVWGHRKEMWVGTWEDTQKGVVLRAMGRQAFRETNWKSHCGDQYWRWSLRMRCFVTELGPSKGMWRTHAGSGTSLRGQQPMEEPQMRLHCPQQSPDRWRTIREIRKFSSCSKIWTDLIYPEL